MHPPSWRREPVYRFVIAFGQSLFRALRLRFTVTGTQNLPRDGSAIVAITHFGYLDFALTQSVLWNNSRRLMRFMATAASFRHPVAGRLMRGMRHIPVERGAGAGSYPVALAALARGEVVGIFPEAEVSTTGMVKPIKTGAVRLARESGAPIVPVAVWGGHRIVTKGHPFRLRNAFRAPVVIVVGPPMHVSGSANAVVATAQLQAALESLVATAKYPESSLYEGAQAA